MPIPPSLLERMQNGQTVSVMSTGTLCSPKLIEMVAYHSKLDGVWIDQEHAAVSHQQLELLLMACRAVGWDAFARVPPTDYATVMRPMETGCSGVMIAQVRTLDQVRQAVQWTKYPPEGVRGLFLGNAEARYGGTPAAEHVEQANQSRWMAVQIETAEAVDVVEQIVANAGVDMLFVGPADLACTLGVPGQAMHSKCQDALTRVADACRAANKPWGVLSRDPDHAAFCRQQGCQLFSIVSDVDLVKRGLAGTEELFASLLA